MSEKSKYYYLSRLSEWRRERRLTQEELARASGVGRTTIAALETGKRRAYSSTARKLAKVLKVKPEDLA
jgi:DNA-binding XRE family transcriptional regulator